MCNRISCFTASVQGIRKDHPISLEHLVGLVSSIIDFFQLLQLCQVQEFGAGALCLWVLQTPSAELCLDVFCSTQGTHRAAGAARIAVPFPWLFHDTAAHLAA